MITLRGKLRFIACTVIVALAVSAGAASLTAGPGLSGMWSDPPPSAIDQFCYFYCTDAGTQHLQGMLDDPANDARPYTALAGEAMRKQMEYIGQRLSASARADAPRGMQQDPAFVNCEPYGGLRQMFALHQLEVKQYRNRVVLHYGEWDATRTVYLDGRIALDSTPSLLGYSSGSYEGDTLVVRTRGVRANLTWWMARHSDQVEVVERYRKSADGKRLELRATVTDPVMLSAPLEVKKAWGWAPREKIYRYVDCEKPADYLPPETKP